MNQTSNGKQGGLIVGNSHENGGVAAVIVDTNTKIEVEGGEAIIKKEAVQKYHKELSRMNQSVGGKPIVAPQFKEGATLGSPVTFPSAKTHGYVVSMYHNDGEVTTIDGLNHLDVANFLSKNKNVLCAVQRDGVDLTKKFGRPTVLRTNTKVSQDVELSAKENVAQIMIDSTTGAEKKKWQKYLNDLK